MLLLLSAFTVMVALIGAAGFLASKPDPDATRMRTRFQGIRATNSNEHSIGSDPLLKQVRKQSRGLIGYLLRRFSAATGLEILLAQANSPRPAKHILLAAACLSLFGGTVAYVFFPVFAVSLLIAIPAGYIPIAVLKFLRKQRISAFEKNLPEVIDTLSRSLRAGHSLVAAINIVTENAPEPARSEFGELFRKQNFGLPLRDAFMQMLDRLPSQDLRVLVTGILLQKETGGNLTHILDHTAGVVRERLKLRGDIRVHTAQGRMTAWILCLLPVAMVLLINLINPGYSRVLTEDPFGRKLLYTGIGLLFAGIILIRRIVIGIEV